MGKFRIKIASSWFSTDYVVLKYSTNGIFWKTVKCYEYDISDEWCYMVTKTSHFSNAKELLSKFQTLEDVIKFENEQRQKVINRNKEISERNSKRKKERDDVYNKFG